MAELVQSQNQSSSVVQQALTSNSSTAVFSSSSSSSFSASSASSASSSSSSSTKVVKQSVTSIKQSSSSSSSTMMSSSSSSSSSSSKMVSIQSSGQSYSDRLAVDLGIADVSKEMERLQLRLGDEMTNIHRDIFRLMPSSPEVQTGAIDGTTTSGTGGFEQFLVKMDSDAIKSCIDKAHDDRVKLNFDVNEFDSETINIRTVGNKIEVHAMKKSKKGDEERSEEFSRVYELPNELDPSHVTSSIYKDGVLTIELPVTDALGPAQ